MFNRWINCAINLRLLIIIIIESFLNIREREIVEDSFIFVAMHSHTERWGRIEENA